MAACSKLYIPNIGSNLPFQDAFPFITRETLDDNFEDDDADPEFSVLNPTHFLSTTFYEEHGTVLDDKTATRNVTKNFLENKIRQTQKLEMSPQKFCKRSVIEKTFSNIGQHSHPSKLPAILDQLTAPGSISYVHSSADAKSSSAEEVRGNKSEQVKESTSVGKKYVCEHCKYTCKCKTVLMNHLKTHTNEETVPHYTDAHKDKSFQKKLLACKICGKMYKKSGSLAKHKLEHEGKGQFKCRFCGEIFASDAERTKHREKFHEKQWKCSTCHHTFATEGKLQTHMQWHENKEMEVYVCNVCSKEFKLKVNLKIHVESKCGTDPQHICQTCGKAFMTRGTLITHTLLHTGEKTFLCRFCGKSFRLKVEMQRHERSHTGEKPFVCKVCSKAFAHRESLITHNTLHTGIRPYMCETCGCTFSCIGNLIKHKKTHRNTCGSVTPKSSSNMSAKGTAKKANEGIANVCGKSDSNLQPITGLRTTANTADTTPSSYNYKQPSLDENNEWLPQQPFFNHPQSERLYPPVDTHIIDKAFKSSHIYWGSNNNIMGMSQDGVQHPFGVYSASARNVRHGVMQTHILYTSSSEESVLQHRQIPVDSFLYNFDSNKVPCGHRFQNLECDKLIYSNYRHYNWDGGRGMCGFKQEDGSLQRDENRMPQHGIHQNSQQQVYSPRDFSGTINVPAHSNINSQQSYQFTGEDRQQACQGLTAGENEFSPSFMSNFVDRPNPYLTADVDFGAGSAISVQGNSKHDSRPEYQQEIGNPQESTVHNTESDLVDKNIPNGQNENLNEANCSLVNSENGHGHLSFRNNGVGGSVEKNKTGCIAKVAVGCTMENKVKMEDETCEVNESADIRSVRERKQKNPIKCDLRATEYVKDDSLSHDSINNSDDSRTDVFVAPVDSVENKMLHATTKDHISCSLCRLEFPNETLLLSHVLINHNQGSKDENNDSEDEKPLIQRISCISFEKTNGSVNSGKNFVCNICKQEFSVEINLKRHLKIHASTSEVPPCCFCGKKYLNKACLLKHEAQHTSTEAFKCKECDELFDDKAVYKRHRHLHLGKQHTCTECQRTFCSASNLRIHMSHKHMGQTPEIFSCQLCGKKFKQKGNLKVHVDSRCGSEPRHVCSVCGKAFMSVGSLTTHFLLHTGEKTFLCRFCGKSFRLKVEMQRHERSHTGEKPFVCKVCGKAFAHRESLVTHNTLHTGVKPYMCEACGCTFSCIGNLIKHKQTYNKRCQNSEK